MDLNNGLNQSYWFVLREDQNNVIFSTSNNITIQNPQITGHEQRYVLGASDDRQFIQINEAPAIAQESTVDTCDTEPIKPQNEDNFCLFWDRKKVKLLLNTCLEDRFKNASKDIHLWNEIGFIVGTGADECSKKYSNLRRTYIRLLKKKRSGKEIKWVHYNTCEEIFQDCKSLPPSVLEPWEDYKIRKLLNLYIDNLYKFRSPDCLQKDIWKEIASQIGTSDYNYCYHKFKNLKRTYFSWLERSRVSGKPIKWDYQHYFERIYHNFKPIAGPWGRDKTRLLMDTYLQIADKFRNPKFQKKELWKDIAAVVGETPNNCDKKFRNLKQTYIRLKLKADSGRSITKWRYYKDFEAIYSNSCDVNNERTFTPIRTNGEDYVKELLSFYIVHKHQFKDPLIKNKNIWKLLSPKIGLSPEECDRKYRNLKQTYIRLSERKNKIGNRINWPYYKHFERIFGEPTSRTSHSSTHIDSITLSEIKRTVQQIQDRKENDHFEKLLQAIEGSNNIQRERNQILLALLNRK